MLTLAACGEAAAPRPVADAETSPPSVATPASPAPAATPERPWLDVRGTSIVGFGILRVVPEPGGAARVTIRYRETPDGYATKGNLQLFVLPADAFEKSDRAYAGDFVAFARTEDEAATDADGALRVEASFDAGPAERRLLVCYGPWTAPDAGRPAGDVPTFSLDVTADHAAWEWIESEAGEMITTNWTGRPEVARGTPVRDPLTGASQWIEVRPMILYDGRMVRSAEERAPRDAGVDALLAEAARLDAEGRAALAADARDRAADAAAHAARSDRRLVLTPALAEKFRRVPIRWR
jgi:hypothetical protein